MKKGKEEITCSKCGETKKLNCFQFRTDSGTYRKQCKICRQEQNTKDKRRRYSEDPEHFKKVRRDYWLGNEKMLAWNREYQKKWRSKNKDSLRKSARERFRIKYGQDIQFTIKHKLRSRLGAAIKGEYKSGSAVEDLGITIDEFMKYMESLFLEGMSWGNYGEWHIDHIVPLSSFDLTDKKQLKKACHYTNLQPLWEKDNLSKGNRLDD